MKRFLWTIFIFLSVAIGLYPMLYFLADMTRDGLLASKSNELLQSKVWHFLFYQHILLGAVAMLTGWSQFSRRIRNRHLTLHRMLGKIYLVAVALSGGAGLYIAQYANGGTISALGFSGLAIAWLFTSVQAYRAILKRDIDHHQYWMIRSYAVCWAAVTLRLWLPLFMFVFNIEFIVAYRIISWFCWVPNLVVAEIIIGNLKSKLFRVAMRSQTHQGTSGLR